MKPSKTTEDRPKRLPPELTRRVIDELGGTVAVAKLCGIKSPSVSEWKHKGMTRSNLLFLREKFHTLPIMRVREIKNF